MKVLFQPTQATPGDWQECDSKDWGRLGEFTVHAICVQGDIYEGPDHYAVREVGSGLVTVTVWHDDPDDWPVGTRWAKVVTYQPLGSDARPGYGGAINVRRHLTVYADNQDLFRAVYPEADVKPWVRFNHSREKGRPGAWVEEAAHAAHQQARSMRGWREWTDKVHPNLIRNGKVVDQRKAGFYEKPKGTRIYYSSKDIEGGDVHFQTAHYKLTVSPAGVQEISHNVGTAGEEVRSWFTAAGEPASAAWPTTGVYRAQLDVIVAGSDLVFGYLTNDGAYGHFGRVNEGLTSCIEHFEQDQSAFFGSGLHLATVTDPAWTAGSATDRLGLSMSAWRSAGHGSQRITIQVGEADDFVDGPWSAGPQPPSADNAPFFGTHF